MELLGNPMDRNIQSVVIPFELKYNPMKKLAIVNFEKKPDDLYTGLELQYFDDDLYGRGYRVIAWRSDGYVDVYDDPSLNHIEDENFDVAGKGLGERINTSIDNTQIHIKEGCVHISFEFIDKKGRPIVVKIAEHATRRTKGLNLLAPVGSSAEKPSYLPLFLLYNFDFVRKHQTDVEILIDGKRIFLDDFPVPVPKDLQWRYYSRYTPDSQIVEFANAKTGKLQEYIPDASGVVLRGSSEFRFEGSFLKRILLKNEIHPLVVEFAAGFPDVRGLKDGKLYEDTFKIQADKGMGLVSGEYSILREADLAKIELIPSGGWTTVPNSLLTKMLFTKKSIFCTWPKTYRYVQEISLNTLESVSYWKRIG